MGLNLHSSFFARIRLRYTNSFLTGGLPKVVLIAYQAYEYTRHRESGQGGSRKIKQLRTNMVVFRSTALLVVGEGWC